MALERIRVLFVDSRNSFRSVVAHSVAKHYSSNSGLSGLFNFDSCGISAINGLSVSKEAFLISEYLKIDLAKHYTKNIYDTSLSSFDVVLYFETWHGHKIAEIAREERIAGLTAVKLGHFIRFPEPIFTSGLSLKERLQILNDMDDSCPDILPGVDRSYEEFVKKAKIIQGAVKNFIYFLLRR